MLVDQSLRGVRNVGRLLQFWVLSEVHVTATLHTTAFVPLGRFARRLLLADFTYTAGALKRRSSMRFCILRYGT